jgi:hypothetical protein
VRARKRTQFFILVSLLARKRTLHEQILGSTIMLRTVDSCLPRAVFFVNQFADVPLENGGLERAHHVRVGDA